ncbi:hypothetical protein [Pedobacter sp. MW01-1-1]|uniref:hypothetical protein n=1 Tax=Pedobacter sp. MW01-1-1 TaxID=3383027 RepID=UPI003FEEB70D
MNKQKQLTPDLEKFIEKFEPTKFKILSSGIEIRGVANIHQAIESARTLIEKLKLKLQVSHHAEMVSYRGFEVTLIK